MFFPFYRGRSKRPGKCSRANDWKWLGWKPNPGPTDPKPGLHPAVGSCGPPTQAPLRWLSCLWESCAPNAAARGQSRIMRDSEGSLQSWAWAPAEFGGDTREVSALSVWNSVSSGNEFWGQGVNVNLSLRGTQALREENSHPLNVHKTPTFHHSFVIYHS